MTALVFALAASVAPASAQQNLLTNADFGSPQAPSSGAGYVLCGAGYQSLAGWQVTRGSVKVVRFWSAPETFQSLDLVGQSPGTIEQSFPTEPGQFYLLAGYMAHNPLNPLAPEGRANVSVNGMFLTQLVHHDPDTTRSQMHWVRFEQWFRADAPTTTLSIADATNTAFAGGLALASLSVRPGLSPDNVLHGGDFEGFKEYTDSPFIWVPHNYLIDGWGQALGNPVLAQSYAWQQIQGNQSLALAGPVSPVAAYGELPMGPGTVGHYLVTEAGRAYTISGWMAHDPSVSEGRAYIIVDGQVVGQVYHSNALYGTATPEDMRWQRFALRFRARHWSTSLMLTAVTQTPPQERGPVLDDLVVTPDPLPEPQLLPGSSSGPPAAPADLTAFIATGPKIDLSWTDRSDNETAFAVWRRADGGDWTRIVVLPPNSTAYLDTSVSTGTSYTYRVQAANNSGDSDWSNEVSLFTPETPAAPSDLIAQEVTPTEINLFWKANSQNESGFLIWKKLGGVGEGYLPWDVVPAHQTWYTDVGRDEWELAGCSTYTYVVMALNPAGVSDFSNPAVVQTLPPAPAAPSNLQVSFVNGLSFRFTWQDNSNNESRFAVWGRKEGGDEKLITAADPNQTFATAYDLAPNTTYTFRVRADNRCASSDWSNEVTVRTRAAR